MSTVIGKFRNYAIIILQRLVNLNIDKKKKQSSLEPSHMFSSLQPTNCNVLFVTDLKTSSREQTT